MTERLDSPLQATIVGEEVVLSRSDDEGPTLLVPLTAWLEFLAGARAGEFGGP